MCFHRDEDVDKLRAGHNRWLLADQLAAGRDKDLAYIRALLKHKLVKRAILEQRLADTEIHPKHRAELLETLHGLMKPKAKRK